MHNAHQYNQCVEAISTFKDLKKKHSAKCKPYFIQIQLYAEGEHSGESIVYIGSVYTAVNWILQLTQEHFTVNTAADQILVLIV